MSKNKLPKVRRGWKMNPVERVVPDKQQEIEPFNGTKFRGQNISEADLNDLDDFFGEE